MRAVPPSSRQVYFSAALAAAAAVLVSPSARWPAAPSASLDAAMVKPARTAEQPVLDGPRAFASYRAAHRPAPRPSPAGSHLRVSDDTEAVNAIPSPRPAPAQQSVQVASAAPEPAPAQSASSYPSYTPVVSQSGAYGSPEAQGGSTSSFQECVIARESGGNSQVMNSSGHYGLYQFSASTWAAYGGNPADFGDASVAEQNQVFDNAIAAGGESNWSPYDGC
jgi:Transglycosylase-like domain